MKPQLFIINSFDANNDTEFTFFWDGNQSFGNICIIRENTSNRIVYQQQQETMQLKHKLSGHILMNGVLYNVSIANIDSDGVISEYSNPVLFHCFTTPAFVLNVRQDQIIRNASFRVEISYSQLENELLQSYEVSLYDANRSRVQSSGIQYNTDNMDYMITSLEDNHSYYIQATGRTINGLEFSTDMIRVTVNYIQPAIYSLVTLENLKDNGQIKVQSNIKSIICKTTQSPIYVNNEYIGLTHDILTIDEDFLLEDDFVIKFSGYMSEGLIMQLFNGMSSTTLFLRRGTYDVNNNQEKSYIELISTSGIFTYRCASNYIDSPSSLDEITVWLTKKNGLFSIELKVGDT